MSVQVLAPDVSSLIVSLLPWLSGAVPEVVDSDHIDPVVDEQPTLDHVDDKPLTDFWLEHFCLYDFLQIGSSSFTQHFKGSPTFPFGVVGEPHFTPGNYLLSLSDNVIFKLTAKRNWRTFLDISDEDAQCLTFLKGSNSYFNLV